MPKGLDSCAGEAWPSPASRKIVSEVERLIRVRRLAEQLIIYSFDHFRFQHWLKWNFIENCIE